MDLSGAQLPPFTNGAAGSSVATATALVKKSFKLNSDTRHATASSSEKCTRNKCFCFLLQLFGTRVFLFFPPLVTVLGQLILHLVIHRRKHQSYSSLKYKT